MVRPLMPPKLCRLHYLSAGGPLTEVYLGHPSPAPSWPWVTGGLAPGVRRGGADDGVAVEPGTSSFGDQGTWLSSMKGFDVA